MLLLRVVLFSSSVFFFLACSLKEPTVNELNTNERKLEALLVNLSPNISPVEAKDFAKSSITYSLDLAKRYETVASPWIHNTLVNLGVRRRGLCYEWSEDLLRFLYLKNYKTLAFHVIGANIGYLDEHNAFSVSAKGDGVENSIVLDAWRNSGHLYFIKISEDKEYEWKKGSGLY